MTSPQSSKSRFDRMIENGEKYNERNKKAFNVLMGAAVTLFATTVGVFYQAQHNHKDLEYLRDNAAPRYAVQSLQKIYKADREAMMKCIDDPVKKDIMESVTKEITPAIDAIIIWNNTIPPRGTKAGNEMEMRQYRLSEDNDRGGTDQ